MLDLDLLRADLFGETRVTVQFVRAVEQFLARKALDTVVQRSVLFQVQTQIIEVFGPLAKRLTAETGESGLDFSGKQIFHETSPFLLRHLLVHLVKQPRNKLMRIVVLVVVKQRIVFLDCRNQFFVVVRALAFLLVLKVLKEIPYFVQHAWVLFRGQF